MYPGDPNGTAAEVVNCRCRSRSDARWALEADATKMLGDTSEMTDEQKKAIADKLGLSVEQLDLYSGQIIPVKAKNYADFKRQYNKLWHYEGSELQKEAEARIAGYKTGKKVDKLEKVNYSGKVTPEIETSFENSLSRLPEAHRTLAETKITGIKVTSSKVGSSFTKSTGIIEISEYAPPNDIIHEYSHALESAVDAYNDPEFVKIMKKGLENIALDDIIYDDKNFVVPIYRIENDKFVSPYQGRLYEEYGIYSGDRISLDGMRDYFAEGYHEYIVNPENLKKHDPDLFAYFERIT